VHVLLGSMRGGPSLIGGTSGAAPLEATDSSTRERLTWVLPFLAYTQPRIARNLLRFRHSMLDKARHRARELDLRGAMFPWRTIASDEASAYHLAGTAQFHINTDIAYAIRRHVDVRGDPGFLVETGAEMLVETARMWVDLGFFGEDDRFHIHGVTGPDEYTAMVDDNAYTNLMARLNLRYAAAAVLQLRAEHPEDFAALQAEPELEPVRAGRVGSRSRAHVRPA
jgi:alpha,alpha-trehalose phosphorylase